MNLRVSYFRLLHSQPHPRTQTHRGLTNLCNTTHTGAIRKSLANLCSTTHTGCPPRYHVVGDGGCGSCRPSKSASTPTHAYTPHSLITVGHVTLIFSHSVPTVSSNRTEPRGCLFNLLLGDFALHFNRSCSSCGRPSGFSFNESCLYNVTLK